MSADKRALLAVVSALGLLIAAGGLSYVNLVEAYGSGPPYYGRSTNMDKWVDPLPVLLAVDVLALLLAGGLIGYAVRRLRKSGERRAS